MLGLRPLPNAADPLLHMTLAERYWKLAGLPPVNGIQDNLRWDCSPADPIQHQPSPLLMQHTEGAQHARGPCVPVLRIGLHCNVTTNCHITTDPKKIPLAGLRDSLEWMPQPPGTPPIQTQLLAPLYRHSHHSMFGMFVCWCRGRAEAPLPPSPLFATHLGV